MGEVSLRIDNNNALANLLLNELIRRIESGNGMDELLMMGCDAEFIDGLRRRPARDILDISSQLRSIDITFSTAEIAQQFNRLDRQRKDDLMCEYFVKNGASRTLISRLFKRSVDEVRKLRQAILPSDYKLVGRSSMPNYEKRDEIHQFWYRLRCENSGQALRDLIYMLHMNFNEYSIDALYSTVTEFEDQADRANSKDIYHIKPIDESVENKSLSIDMASQNRSAV